jgi:hypothetical protein
MSWSVSAGEQGAGRLFAGTYSWLFMLPVIAFACATSTFYFCDNISTSPLRWLPFALGASAPVLWIAVAARIMPGSLSVTLLKAHAVFYAVLVIIKIAMAAHHHGNIIHALARLIDWIENIVVLMGDTIVIAVAWRRSRGLSRGRKGPAFVYASLTVSLLAGWYAGLQAWSFAFRPKLIAAAETQAADQSYCIEVDGRPARTAADLTGLGMRARNDGGWTWYFHALLVMTDGTERTYFNWSYVSGRFEPVTLHARAGLNLDFRVTCKPVKHFALGLM